MPEELWQEYNEQGNPVGSGLTKEDSARGVLHGSSHVWLWRKTSAGVQLLMQLRGPNEITYPSHWDVSAAGHIDFGEEPLRTATRELNEELGVQASQDRLQLLFTHRSDGLVPDTNIIENECQFIYLLEVGDDMVLNPNEEVSDTAWLTLADIRAKLDDVENSRIIDHGNTYFGQLFSALESKQ